MFDTEPNGSKMSGSLLANLTPPASPSTAKSPFQHIIHFCQARSVRGWSQGYRSPRKITFPISDSFYGCNHIWYPHNKYFPFGIFFVFQINHDDCPLNNVASWRRRWLWAPADHVLRVPEVLVCKQSRLIPVLYRDRISVHFTLLQACRIYIRECPGTRWYYLSGLCKFVD